MTDNQNQERNQQDLSEKKEYEPRPNKRNDDQDPSKKKEHEPRPNQRYDDDAKDKKNQPARANEPERKGNY
jgi:hypothetical protein